MRYTSTGVAEHLNYSPAAGEICSTRIRTGSLSEEPSSPAVPARLTRRPIAPADHTD
jgi:hypothetical protein